MPTHPQRIWLAAIVTAWCADFLFWNKPAGISVVIFVGLVLAAGIWTGRVEKARLHWTTMLLAGLALIGAMFTAWRAEPFTRTLNLALATGALVLVGIAQGSGAWLRYGVLDHLVAAARWVAGTLSRAARLPLFPAGQDQSSGQNAFRRGVRASLPVLRGLLLAVPIVTVFAALLALADPIFSDRLNHVLRVIDLRRLPEYLVRLVLISWMAYLFAGSLLHTLLPNPPTSKNDGSLSIARFLGWIEAVIILGSVIVLFSSFVVVQFQYFFGGQTNINAEGYTYAEYARRGFFELVSVAVLSLMLVLSLGAVAKRELPGQFKIFTALSAFLVANVGVMLVSAFMRLQLYEEAYGFTRLRTYTHLFIPWLGVVLLVSIVLQGLRREKFFIAAALAAAAGFTLTVGTANVDGFITRQNIQRANLGAELDGVYLVNLSDDALPDLTGSFSSPATRSAVRDELGAVLACRVYRLSKETQRPWQSYHPGEAAARARLVGLDLGDFPVHPGSTRDDAWAEYGQGQSINCYDTRVNYD